MHLTFLGTFYSVMTGLILACFYLLNKKVAPLGKALPIIFGIFLCHLPIFMIWVWLRRDVEVSPAYFLPGLGVIGLTVAGNMLTIRALSLSPFSLMVPVLGLSPVFASLLGIPLLQEWPSHLQWVGIVLAVLGVLWLYAPVERPWDIFSFWSSFVRERGALSMAGAAFLWALSSPMDRLSLRYADPSFHALFVFIGFVITLGILLTLRDELSSPVAFRYWPILFFTGTLGALAYILQLLALQQTPAGPFEAIKRVMSQILALLFGYFLFDEVITKPKLIGLAILSIGVPLIVL